MKLFHVFCQRAFKRVIFAVEILESINKIFQEYFLDNPVFKLVATQKPLNKIFKEQLQTNPFLM